MFVVFFSFKGGVGRSSCLMNTARNLAKRGKDVVLMDFDIAAPGMDIFEGTNISVIMDSYKDESYQDGIVEYLMSNLNRIDFKRAACTIELDNIMPYSYEFRIAEGDGNKWKIPPAEGRTYIIRAGAHEVKDVQTQNRKIFKEARNNYEELQRELESKISDVIAEIDEKTTERANYKRFLERFREMIEERLKPDYVLIDARPGLSSISIMAMQKLADIVVLCFNINPWNFKSITNVYKALMKDWKEKYLSNRRPEIILVVTPVPRYATQFKDYTDRFYKISDEMSEAVNPGSPRDTGGTGREKPVVIPYNEQMALRDVLIMDDPEAIDDPTTRGYMKIADLLIRQNPADIENRIRRVKEKKTPEEVTAEFQLLTRTTERIEVYHRYGEYLLESLANYAEAIHILDRAISKAKTDTEADKKEGRIYAGYSDLNFLFGRAYYNSKDYKKAKECFGIAFEHDNTNHRAKAMEGESHYKMAIGISSIDTRKKELETSREIFNSALKIRNEPEYNNNLGLVLMSLAELGEVSDNERLRADAAKAFQEATLRRRDYSEAYFNAGKNYYNLSQIMSIRAIERGGDNFQKQRNDYLNNAANMFAQATKYKDDYFEAYYMWALTLSRIAGGDVTKAQELLNKANETPEVHHLRAQLEARIGSTMLPDERVGFLTRACTHFSSASVYKKDFREAYFFWGAVLFILQRQKEESKKEEKGRGEAELDFRDAFYKLEQAIALFFDYPNFYFDSDEIEEVSKNTYDFVYTLEQMFTERDRDKVYKRVKKVAGISMEDIVTFEPQFQNWLNKQEQESTKHSAFYEKLILKAVFKDFMTENEKRDYEPLESKLKQKSTEELLNLVQDMAERDKWKNRKSA